MKSTISQDVKPPNIVYMQYAMYEYRNLFIDANVPNNKADFHQGCQHLNILRKMEKYISTEKFASNLQRG